MKGRIQPERGPTEGTVTVQKMLFPMTVTAVRREIAFARSDGGPTGRGLNIGTLGDKKSSHTGPLRAHLTAERAAFREEIVTRDSHMFTAFHVKRSETGR